VRGWWRGRGGRIGLRIYYRILKAFRRTSTKRTIIRKVFRRALEPLTAEDPKKPMEIGVWQQRAAPPPPPFLSNPIQTSPQTQPPQPSPLRLKNPPIHPTTTHISQKKSSISFPFYFVKKSSSLISFGGIQELSAIIIKFIFLLLRFQLLSILTLSPSISPPHILTLSLSRPQPISHPHPHSHSSTPNLTQPTQPTKPHNSTTHASTKHPSHLQNRTAKKVESLLFR
jgi:hypothetical protein